MKQIVQVRLDTDSAQLDALCRTLVACNETATMVAKIAREQNVYRSRDLRAITYAQARSYRGLGAQVAQSCIRKVADSYTTLRANLRSGRYGQPGSKRRTRVESNPIEFRSWAAQPFDDRCLSWSHDLDDPSSGWVSIWTVDGRCKDIRFTGDQNHIALLRAARSGETDLIIRRQRRGGQVRAFLLVTVEIAEPALSTGEHLATPEGWIGVDLGIENIAVTSDRVLAQHLMTTYGSGAPDGPAGRGSTKDRRTKNRELRHTLAS